MSDNPGSVPWQVANPYKWTHEETTATARRLGRASSSAAELEDVDLDDAVLQAVADDVDTAVGDATEKELPFRPVNSVNSEGRPRGPLFPRNTQIVKSGASFNSPWVIEEKPA
jgi:hypothetical protein